jgi:hypothetical protein
MPNPYQGLMVRIAAEESVLFEPFRQPHDLWKVHWAIQERRAEFHKTGLPFAIGGSEERRKRGSRRLQSLIEAGMVVSTGGTHPHVKLTTAGENKIRTVLGCYRVDQHWDTLEVIGQLTDMELTNRGHVPEWMILGLRDQDYHLHQRHVVDLEMRCEPFLIRGWLESSADGYSHVGYMLTEAGEAALAAGCPDPGELPEFDWDTGERFNELVRAGRARRMEWKRRDKNNLWLCLSAGLWPEEREGLPHVERNPRIDLPDEATA